MIVGIDEVGRGAWAGPLVVGAVVLGGVKIDGLTDSKKLTKKRREELSLEIEQKAAAIGLGWVEASEIDVIGLSQALKLATRRAVEKINTPYHEIIIDGTVNFLEGTNREKFVSTMKKADLLVPSVSAASIVAKVARDKFMAEQDSVFEGYNFKSHVGYGTAAHSQAIDKLGVTPLHRLSFAPLTKFQPKTQSETPTQAGVVKQGLGLERTTKRIGDDAEQRASEFLRRKDHQILDRNWRTKFCEIDIISKKGETIFFHEVKYRKNADHGGGIAAITKTKQRQMKFAAEFFVVKNKLQKSNLLLTVISMTGSPPEVEEYLEIS